ncbi:ACP phosphodiesterase [Siphonobacter sp.]|uniref:acyl carrier protein phosphodiesterase n=1 Tax=Siphonobacter sp. TaxID=1869184 RepID=UPI003B3BB627
MNFLAHTLLSGTNSDVQVGNLLGEFVKGRLENYHPPGITTDMLVGVRLHRIIDDFTDHHPITRRSKSRLVDEYGLLSGILVDMFYDYVLAREWATYSVLPLPLFAQQFYEAVDRYRPFLPASMQSTVQSMISRDWFTNYATLEGIEWSLRGIGRRFPPAAGIERSITQLERDYAFFKADFEEFWPDLSQRCFDYLSSIN